MKKIEDTSVLIVEDDHLVMEMVRGMLEELGYSIAGEAEDGHEAVEMVRKMEPDVVLMDIKMPRMSGIESAMLIQKHFPTPVVILSAYQTEDLVQDAYAAGVGAYVVKPPKSEDLLRGIEVAIGRFGDMRELKRMTGKYRRALRRIEELSRFFPRCPLCGKMKSGEDFDKKLTDYIAEIPDSEYRHYLCSECDES